MVFVAVLLLFWAVMGPWPTSWVEAPIFERDTSRSNCAAWEQLSRSPKIQAQTGVMHVGVGVVDLSRRMQERWGRNFHLPLAGHGRRAFTRGNTGVADPICVKSICIDNGARTILIVSADLLLINRRLADETIAELRVRGFQFEREDILFGATHTHSSYAGYTDRWIEIPSVGFYRPDVCQTIVTALADACELSLTDRQPASLAHLGRDLSADGLVVHRLDRHLPTHDWLDVLTFRHASTDHLLATITIFSAHATCHPRRHEKVSGDYPGVVCRYVQKATKAPCLFLAGAVGSMGPVDLGSPREEWAEKLGSHLGQAVTESIARSPTSQRTVQIATAALKLSLPRGQIKLGQQWRCSPIVSSLLVPAKSTIHAMRLGPVGFLSVPADYSGDLAADLRQQVLAGPTWLTTSFGGDYLGYILPDHFSDEPTYEALSASLFGSHAGTFFHRQLRQLADLLNTADPHRTQEKQKIINSFPETLSAN
jgi:hypothetical protein